jgi:hypothetical protein
VIRERLLDAQELADVLEIDEPDQPVLPRYANQLGLGALEVLEEVGQRVVNVRHGRRLHDFAHESRGPAVAQAAQDGGLGQDPDDLLTRDDREIALRAREGEVDGIPESGWSGAKASGNR